MPEPGASFTSPAHRGYTPNGLNPNKLNHRLVSRKKKFQGQHPESFNYGRRLRTFIATHIKRPAEVC